MDLHEAVDLITRNGFALVFAVWALFRLDAFLRKLVENDTREIEIQGQMVTKLDKLSELLNLALRAK